MSDTPRPATLGELRASGWTSIPVKDELRRNAVARIAAGEQLIPSVLGYEDTVLPQRLSSRSSRTPCSRVTT